MEAYDDALEKLVRVARCCGQKVLIVRGDATDQAIGRFDGTNRSWIDIVDIDAFRNVNLAAAVHRLFGSRDLIEKRRTFVGEDKAALDVVALIAAGEFCDADAGGLKP